MDKRYRSKGLTIIAAECQNTSEEKIGSLLDKHKAKFTVTRHSSGPINARGIPNAYVFDVRGQLIFKGHPASKDFNKIVKKALREFQKDSKETKEKGDLIPVRNWKSSEGKSLQAAVVEIRQKKVIFKLSNGRKVPYEISKLSEEDQALIKENAQLEE